MPFAPVPIYGGGAGVASAVSGIQDRQDRQRDFMLQLLAHAQNQQALQQYRQAQLQQNELIKQQTADAATERARTATEGRAMNEARMIPTDQNVDPSDIQRLTSQGVPSTMFRPTPINAPDAPSSIAAPDQPQGQPMAGTAANSPQPSAMRFQRIATPEEQERSSRDKATESQRQFNNALGLRRVSDAEGNAANKSDIDWSKVLNANQPSHFTPVTQYDETGKPVGTVAFDTRRGTTTNVTAPGGAPLVTRPAPGAAQAAQQSAKKKDALDTLDQLDAAIDSAKDLIGPAAGRIGGAQQWIGDADPRLQALGTKMLIAKMKIDASLGGMRAAASPQILARWDNLLANKVTPEGMKASTQAMREILGGSQSNDIRVGGTFNGKKILKVEPVQ